MKETPSKRTGGGGWEVGRIGKLMRVGVATDINSKSKDSFVYLCTKSKDLSEIPALRSQSPQQWRQIRQLLCNQIAHLPLTLPPSFDRQQP